MSRTNIYIVIILFLLVTNVATVVTVATARRKAEQAEKPVIEQALNSRMDYANRQIGLEPGSQEFMGHNRRFNSEAIEISNRLNLLRSKMVDELALNNPDTVKLNRIASEIGELHKELKETTIDYYLSLKETLDSNQQQNLHYLFRDMLDPDGMIYGRGRGGRGFRERPEDGRRQDQRFENERNPRGQGRGQGRGRNRRNIYD